MNYSDFAGEPYRHPEIDDNPEALYPATQETKTELRDAIFGIVGELSVNASWKFRQLDLDDEPEKFIIATRYSDDGSNRFPGKVAQISINDFSESIEGDAFRTTCAIIDSPDGLQLQQSTSMHTPPQIGSIDVAKAQARQETAMLENELGFSFVSEQEARSLVEIIAQSS